MWRGRHVLCCGPGRRRGVGSDPVVDAEQAGRGAQRLRTSRLPGEWTNPVGRAPQKDTDDLAVIGQVGGQVSRARGQPVEGKFVRSEEHTSELQSRFDLVCRLLLEKKKT